MRTTHRGYIPYRHRHRYIIPLYYIMSYVLDTNIQSNTIYLDTREAERRNPFFVFSLNTTLRPPLNANMLLSVQNVSFNNTFYNVTSSNNLISFNYDAGQGNNKLAIEIPVGIYNVYTFIGYINNILNTYYGANRVVLQYDTNTFTITIFPNLLTEIINIDNYPTTCGNLIGVSKDDDNNYIFPVVRTPFLGGFQVRLPNPVDFTGTPYVFLKIQNVNLTNINSRGEITDTLLRIPMNAQQGQVIHYRPTELVRFLLGDAELSTIAIRFTDLENTNLQIRGEVQLVLRIEYKYPAEDRQAQQGTIDYFIRKERERLEALEEDDDDEDEGSLL
jgi:hypothetical protein